MAREHKLVTALGTVFLGITTIAFIDPDRAIANNDFALVAQADANPSIVDATVSQLMGLTDDVSIQWSIYDANDVLVGTGMYPSDGSTLPVPPGFTHQIQAPTSNPPYQVDVVGMGDRHNHSTGVSGILFCLSPVMAAAPAAAVTGEYKLHVAPAIHVHGTTRWHVPVSVHATTGHDDVRLMYYAFWKDAKGKRHFLHCFPRNNGMHHVDHHNNIDFNEDVLVEIPNSVSGPVTFGVDANDHTGNTPHNPQDESITILH